MFDEIVWHLRNIKKREKNRNENKKSSVLKKININITVYKWFNIISIKIKQNKKRNLFLFIYNHLKSLLINFQINALWLWLYSSFFFCIYTVELLKTN